MSIVGEGVCETASQDACVSPSARFSALTSIRSRQLTESSPSPPTDTCSHSLAFPLRRLPHYPSHLPYLGIQTTNPFLTCHPSILWVTPSPDGIVEPVMTGWCAQSNNVPESPWALPLLRRYRGVLCLNLAELCFTLEPICRWFVFVCMCHREMSLNSPEPVCFSQPNAVGGGLEQSQS